jgi:hypothetical protein
MAEFMGVRVDPIDESVSSGLQILSEELKASGNLEPGGSMYALDGRLNAGFKAVNLLLDEGVEVLRVDKAASGLRSGDFILSGGSEAVLRDVAQETGVDFKAIEKVSEKGIHKLRRMRVGMYQRYWGGNMDEGWTRFVLEQFAFPYTSLKDAEIKKGGLLEKYDVIILPSDSTGMITGQIPPNYRRFIPTAVPPEYRSGIGNEGVEALKAFVREGGALITFADACGFAIEKFGLSVRNVTAGIPPKEFYCAGSTLRVNIDTDHPLAYGMPEEGFVVFYSSQAFEVTPGQHNENYQTLVRFVERDILQSGWLIGEEYLSGKAAMISAKHGKGELILIGFRTQHRSQTHGTYKLLFNALMR